jgi:DNA-binding IclR family transcriptional regulator
VSAGESRTVLRAIRVLDCFSPEQPELGVRDLARRIGMASSTVGRLLATLEAARVLDRNPAARTYSLGPRVLAWAGVYTAALDVRTRARPILEMLRRATRETVSLYVRDGTERVCVERLESHEGIRAVVRVGERMPLYAGASGKALLAFLPAEERKALLRSVRLTRLTPRTITSRARLERELAAVRAAGHAVSVGERTMAGASVAAPIRGGDGAVVAALNLTGPAERVAGSKLPEYVRRVTAAAAAISHEMGYAPPASGVQRAGHRAC